jgi:hypothetical protein
MEAVSKPEYDRPLSPRIVTLAREEAQNAHF